MGPTSPCSAGSVTGALLGGAIGGAGEYLAISALANGINPSAKDPTIEGTATAALTGAAGGLIGKWLGLLGCFVGGTQVTLTALPQTDSIRKAVWTNWNDPSESYIDEIVGAEPQSDIATCCSLKIAIEKVPLGSLVPTKNPKPWEYDDSLPEPNESSWQHVTLTIERNDGATVDVELLRPSTWIEQNGLTASRRLPIHIPELEVCGLATVHSVEPCPTLAVGEGSFVTGRFVTRRVEQTIEIELEDGSTIEGTPIHPVWSLDRNDWTPLGDLRDGELLQSEFGPTAVTKRRVHNKPTVVYNIEVHGEHVYQVGELGLLVHNACPAALPIMRSAQHGGKLHDNAMKLFGTSKLGAGFLTRTNQVLTDGVNVLSRLRPDIQWVQNGKIHLAEVTSLTGAAARAYHRARELQFRQILGPLFGGYTPLP